jgi:hypothetical protein
MIKVFRSLVPFRNFSIDLPASLDFSKTPFRKKNREARDQNVAVSLFV